MTDTMQPQVGWCRCALTQFWHEPTEDCPPWPKFKYRG